VVTVRDRGRGLRGGPSPDGGLGLGVGLICSAASAVVMSDPADGGAEVRMRFGTA
jgi:hypothetical protein